AAGFPIWVIYGNSACIGFIVGATVSALSFLWLQQSSEALLQKMVRDQRQSKGIGMVFRFVFRYVLVVAVGYVITLSSHLSLYGFAVGLMLWIAALLWETVYQAMHGIHHAP